MYAPTRRFNFSPTLQGTWGDVYATTAVVTQGGDSGAPVVDGNNAVVGHVVGEFPVLASQAKEIVDEAVKTQPNKSRLQRMGDGLKKTADFLKETVPSAVTIATQMVALVSKIHGIGA